MKIDPAHTFITSDHHFGDDESADKALIQKWNSIVKADDIVIYAGDMSDYGLSKLLEIKLKLNGKIIYIKGNHDTMPNNVYKAIFGEVHSSILLEDFDLVVTHVPDPEILREHKLVYGHMHIDDGFLDLPRDKAFCCCQMRNDGYPISIEKILEMMSDNELSRKV